MPEMLQSESRVGYTDLARLLMKAVRVRRASVHSAATAPLDDERSREEAADLAAQLEAMGPTFVKLGQLLSTRADLLPPIYLDALGRLQDAVEPFSFGEVERIVQGELGARLSKAFAWFESTPVAAASLGQVHRAALRDGRIVAVKVQRPNVRERIVQDLDLLEGMAEFVERHSTAAQRYRIVRVLNEFRATLLRELDYGREAQNLSILGTNLADYRRIVVPQPVEDYTTARVLTLDFVRGTKITKLSPLVRLEVDGLALADELFGAYLHQVIVDGFFHADPHPGNVFLTDDGRLALLDLGMVSRLSPGMQERLLKLVLALAEGQSDTAAARLLELGERTDDLDEAAFEREVSELVLRYQDAAVREIPFGRLMMELVRSAADHGVDVPSELTLLGKTMLNLDEIGRTLAPEFDIDGAIRRHAADLMQRQMRRSLSPASVFSSMLEVKEFAERFPSRVNRLLDSMVDNQWKLRVEMIDEGAVMDGLQKVANRITLGLLLASLILGAALMMRVETEFRILGYPGLAMIFFLLAAAGAVWLGYGIVSRDRPRRRPS